MKECIGTGMNNENLQGDTVYLRNGANLVELL